MNFSYMRDRVFLVGVAAYVCNRWLLLPHIHAAFMQSHFNDVLLIPCALPPILWLHRRLGLRDHDEAPRIGEVSLHLVFWSVLFEGIGPAFVPHATGDLGDVAAYVAGGLLACLWWS